MDIKEVFNSMSDTNRTCIHAKSNPKCVLSKLGNSFLFHMPSWVGKYLFFSESGLQKPYKGQTSTPSHSHLLLLLSTYYYNHPTCPDNRIGYQKKTHISAVFFVYQYRIGTR